MIRTAFPLLIVGVSACAAPVTRPMRPAIPSPNALGRIVAPCPAEPGHWQVIASAGPGIDDRPMFRLTGEIHIRSSEWAELVYEATPDTPANLYPVRLDVYAIPGATPTGVRSFKFREAWPIGSPPGIVLVTCGGRTLARLPVHYKDRA